MRPDPAGKAGPAAENSATPHDLPAAAVRIGGRGSALATFCDYMQKLQGIAVSPGVAIGEAMVVDTEGFRIPRRFVSRDAVEDELERLNGAMEAAGLEIETSRDAISRELGSQYAAIFEAHLQMLRDPRLRSEFDGMIR
ncbi:MAG: phosphoenolpyruvate-utilizing N-terminal domain-containing protein, partial [Pirellulales bacterium]